jgi:hypothetical protein
MRRSSKYGEKTNVGTSLFAYIIPGFLFIILCFFLIPLFFFEIFFTIGFCFGLNELCKRRRQKKNGKWEWCRERQSHSMWSIGGVKTNYDKKHLEAKE